MPLQVDTHTIKFNSGGFAHSPNSDLLPSNTMVEPSRNINIHRGGWEKRGGTAKLFATAITGNPKITGLWHFDKRGGSHRLVAYGDNGTITRLDGGGHTTLASALGTGVVPSACVFNDKLYICNTINQVKVWDGVAATTTDLANPAADWGTASPKQIIVHGRGNSRRMWAIAPPGFEENVYISGNDTDNFVTGADVMTIDTGDPLGLVAGVEFGDRIILFSKNRSYLIDDSSLNMADWGWEQAQWSGGVASHRLIVKTPNDLICMTEDGEIYSVAAAQSYGDYVSASLSRQAFISDWIRENIDLITLDVDGHAVFDPKLRMVKFFLRRAGQTQVDHALTYFTDRPPAEAWTIHDGAANTGYRAASSVYGHDPSNNNKFQLTGDYSGFVWKLEQTLAADDTAGYTGKIVLPSDPFNDPRSRKVYRKGHLVARAGSNFTVSVKTLIDGVSYAITLVSFSAGWTTYGGGVYGTAVYGGERFDQKSFENRGVGTRIQYEIFNGNYGESFFISELMTDFTLLGAKTGWSK